MVGTNGDTSRPVNVTFDEIDLDAVEHPAGYVRVQGVRYEVRHIDAFGMRTLKQLGVQALKAQQIAKRLLAGDASAMDGLTEHDVPDTEILLKVVARCVPSMPADVRDALTGAQMHTIIGLAEAKAVQVEGVIKARAAAEKNAEAPKVRLPSAHSTETRAARRRAQKGR